MTRRKFSREFKIEATGLVTDLSVAVAQMPQHVVPGEDRQFFEVIGAPVPFGTGCHLTDEFPLILGNGVAGIFHGRPATPARRGE